MAAGVAEVAADEHLRLVEQAGRAFLRVAQGGEEVAEDGHLRALDDAELVNLRLVPAVMGKAVVVLAHAFNRRLQVHAANEDGHDARGVGLEGELGEIQEDAGAADVVAVV